MKRTMFWALSALAIAAVISTTTLADMGRVYVSTVGATVSEDAQKAIILHNNAEEVLILGTELRASRRTPIVRFIPFPSEPQVALAPRGAFQALAAAVAKYNLRYVTTFHSKGGPAETRAQGVEVRLAVRLGAHDLTVIRIRDVKSFRDWISSYFRRKGLAHKAAYPAEEAVVADYVARGIDFFVLDAVDVGPDRHFVDPIAYRFRSAALYYPLKTSNTFGGTGEIELFVVSPRTLCAPGSGGIVDQFDEAVAENGALSGHCLGLPVKASTSARLVPEEDDLAAIYPQAREFFGTQPVFLQAIRYSGKYEFDSDVLVPMPQGIGRALDAAQPDEGDAGPFSSLLGGGNALCRTRPERGECKGMFETYYFDAASGSCKMFIWGGCGGVVPFKTLDDCRKTCTPALPHRPEH